MQINPISFKAQTCPCAEKKSGRKKAVVGTIIAAAAIGGAYALGKKSINVSDLAEMGPFQKIAKTVIEGFKSMPKYATELFNSLKDKFTKNSSEIVEDIDDMFEGAM